MPSRNASTGGNRPLIVIVEDNPADVYLIRKAIELATPDADLHILKDGEQAIRYFDEMDTGDAPAPAIVLLDINLPKKQGGDVLLHLRQSRRSAGAPVIAVSSSDSPRDRELMQSLGANDYFHKPSQHAAFMKLGDLVGKLIGRRE